MQKVKMTKQEFDEEFEIEEITEETPTAVEDTTPEPEPKEESVLTEEEQEIDDKFLEQFNIDEEKE